MVRHSKTAGTAAVAAIGAAIGASVGAACGVIGRYSADRSNPENPAKARFLPMPRGL
jgi:hypothetical protein